MDRGAIDGCPPAFETMPETLKAMLYLTNPCDDMKGKEVTYRNLGVIPCTNYGAWN